MTKYETTSPLVRQWLHAAELLGLDVEAPCPVTLPSGATVVADVLVRQFGASRGMLVMRSYDGLRGRGPELQGAGFGHSVMDDPGPTEVFAVENYIEVLRDWGWSGARDDEPSWMGGQ